MVEFMSGYKPPMDREFDQPPFEPLETGTIEEPIIPIGELGTTSIDFGQGNLLTNLDKNIRMGTKKIQLVIAGGQGGSPSALASSYGKDVRREVKEKAMASGVDIVGVELSPQRIAGLTGFNPQSNSISEEQRQQDIRQVKDAIKFAADIGARGVDIWSNEFNRNIIDQEWNRDEKGNKLFFDYSPEELKDIKKAQVPRYLVDERTGQIIRESIVRTNDIIHRVKYQTAADMGRAGKKDKSGRVLKPDDYVDIEGNYVDYFDEEAYRRLVPKFDEQKHVYEMEPVDWDKIVAEAQEYNRRHGYTGDRAKSPEEYAFDLKMRNQQALARGQSLHYGHNLDLQLEQIRELSDLRNFAADIEKGMNEEQKQKWIEDNVYPLFGGRRGGGIPESFRQKLAGMSPSAAIQEAIDRQYNELQGFQEMVRSYRAQEEEIKEIRAHVVRPDKYAKVKTFDSYAEAGLEAWRQTRERKLDKPLYVGPEIGWAGQSYGGHPEEFIEIVEKSRSELAKKLEREGLSPDAAKQQAKNHVKGMLDTSHLSMWYKHFAPKEGESEEKRLKRFQDWMKKEVKRMVEKDVIGGVQIVDSITGEHAHLPAGQGIFDMVGLVRTMREAGFKGDLISEGHEEEQFTSGRILTATWNAFGSPITSARPGDKLGLNTWRGVQHSYFGYQMPHRHIIAGYAPSNDWSLWSETPFE